MHAPSISIELTFDLLTLTFKTFEKIRNNHFRNLLAKINVLRYNKL